MPKLLKIDAGRLRLTMLPMNEQHWPAIDKSKPPYTALNRSGGVAMRCGDWLDAKVMPPYVIYGRKVDDDCRTLPGQAPLPDVLVADGSSRPPYKTLVVSDRFKHLLERMDPYGAQYFEVGFIHYFKGRVTDYDGRWWLLNFLRFHDSIDEAKSNRHWLEGYARGTEKSDPVLVAAPGIPDENVFWCGADVRHFKREERPEAGVIYREPPLDMNRGVDTYCSDAFYEAACADGLDFCDGAWSLEAPTAPAALGSPAVIADQLQDCGEPAYQLALHSSYLFAVEPDRTRQAKMRLLEAERALRRGESIGDFEPPEVSHRPATSADSAPFPDIFSAGSDTGICISAAIRDVIERLELGVHHYLPFDLLEFYEGQETRRRFYLFRCGNAVNTVIGAASPDLHEHNGDRIVLDASVVGNRHLWKSDTRPLPGEELLVSATAFRSFVQIEPKGIGFQRRLRLAKVQG
ncbi:MAG: DUF1629 domain-containing protein [Pseudomonadota bacterium]